MAVSLKELKFPKTAHMGSALRAVSVREERVRFFRDFIVGIAFTARQRDGSGGTGLTCTKEAVAAKINRWLLSIYSLTSYRALSASNKMI